MKQKTRFISLQLLPPLMKFYPQTDVKVILFLSDISPVSSCCCLALGCHDLGGLVPEHHMVLIGFLTMLLHLARTRACNCFGILRFQETVGTDSFGSP